MASVVNMDVAKRYNSENLQPWIVEVVASMTSLAVLAVILRMLWNLAVVGFMFAMYSAGMGLHADQVPMSSIIIMAKWLLVAEILYAWNLCWTKIAVLLMYYRVFRFAFFRHMAYGVGAFVVIWGVTITFLFLFICVPVQNLWYPELPGHCIDQVGTWIPNAASTIFTDLIILLLPIRQVWKLQLKIFEKIGLTITFSLGFFVVFASAYRFSVLFSYTNSDPTYTLAPTVGWTSIEMSVGIVSACLPVMRPVVQFCGHKLGLDGLFSQSRSQPPTEISRSRSARHTSKTKTPTLTNLELDKISSKSRDTNNLWLTGDDIDSERIVEPRGMKLRPEHGFE